MGFDALGHPVQDARPKRAVVFPVRLTEARERCSHRLSGLALPGERVAGDHLARHGIDTVLVLRRVSPAAVDPMSCDCERLAALPDGSGVIDASFASSFSVNRRALRFDYTG
jgi:hypothetical protein